MRHYPRKQPSKEATEPRPRRPYEDLYPRSRGPSLEDVTSTVAMPSAGVGRRDSRPRGTRHGQHSAPNDVSATTTSRHERMYPIPPPWSIKGGGKLMQRASDTNTRVHTHSRTHTPHHTGHGSSSPSPTLLVNPYYEQHVTRCIAPLLDVRPRGRNQDKTPSLTLAIRETSDGNDSKIAHGGCRKDAWTKQNFGLCPPWAVLRPNHIRPNDGFVGWWPWQISVSVVAPAATLLRQPLNQFSTPGSNAFLAAARTSGLLHDVSSAAALLAAKPGCPGVGNEAVSLLANIISTWDITGRSSGRLRWPE
nr:unnamed protein product [Digitaria exilis]